MPVELANSKMKLLDLAKKLKQIYDEHGDIDVMLLDPDRYEPHMVSSVRVSIVEEGEWPDDWNMPEGYTHVSIRA